ncbi:MAG TPA: hypothetical protein VEK57_01070 [Thermoanaerobaculia bacterium]|nr:hypothetical protein [Thermoanaerobaculia bacterium]
MPLELGSQEPVLHAAAAQEILDTIDTIKTAVPGFIPASHREAKRLGRIAATPEVAVEAVSALVQRNERMQMIAGKSAEVMRNAMALALAYEPVVQQLFAVGYALAHTIRAARAEAGYCARDVYVMATRFSTRPEGIELVPFVEDLKKKLSRGRKQKADGVPPATTPADPATPATPVKK